MEQSKYHRLDVPIFQEKSKLNWLVPDFLRVKYIQNKQKGNRTKVKSNEPELLKSLNMNQFQASCCSDFLFRGLSLEN